MSNNDKLVKKCAMVQGRMLVQGRPVTPDMTPAQKKVQELLNAGYKPTPTGKLL